MVNSRNKWNAYERKLMNEYQDLWFEDCLTSRNESKRLDDSWVDLAYTDPFNIQAKAYKNFSWWQIIKTLKNMPKDSNFNILHLKIDKVWERGEVVAIDKKDWYEILKMLKSNDII